MLYDVTVKVDDATFDVDQIEARANYKVKNEACVPLTPVSGVKIAPIKTIQLDARKVDDFTYRFAVYADALQDEDYFGQGMCHWSLEAATFFGHRAGRTISAHLFADDMFVAKQVVLYYPRTWVLAPPGGFTESGTPSADTYRDPSNVFTIRVEAKERKR